MAEAPMMSPALVLGGTFLVSTVLFLAIGFLAFPAGKRPWDRRLHKVGDRVKVNASGWRWNRFRVGAIGTVKDVNPDSELAPAYYVEFDGGGWGVYAHEDLDRAVEPTPNVTTRADRSSLR